MPTDECILDPDRLTDEERRSLQKQIRHVRANTSGEARKVTLEVEEGETTTITLPESIAGALLDTLIQLAEGQAVSIAEADEKLTTREAAELLNVSRPHLVKLLKEGEIPSHKVGSHHRVYRQDVLAYRAKRRKESEEAMQALTEESQKLGLGYE